jgi:D-alanyl-D-alanine carboxypeptidase
MVSPMRDLDTLAAKTSAGLVGEGLAGAAIAIRLRTGETGQAAAGAADLARGTSLAPQHQFRIASISKTFVFATILRLHEAGTLHLDAPIARFLPDLPYADAVTLRHILMQTGGLPVWATDRVEEIPPAAGWSPRAVIDFHYARTPASPPGGGVVYANVGSRVAGHIAELATGTPIPVLIRRLFLDPLGLADTVPSGSGEIRPPRLCHGYAFDVPGAPRDVTWDVPQAWLWSGGDMYATPADLTRWADALFTGRVLGPLTAALLTERVPGSFHGSTMSHHGLGIMVFTRGMSALGYRGTTPGFVSILGHEPDSGTSVAVLTNSFSPDPHSLHRSGVERAMFDILDRLAGG